MNTLTEIESGICQGADPGVIIPTHIKVIINLRDDIINMPLPRYTHAYLWIPLQDNVFPGINWLDSLVDFIISQRKSGLDVLIHCAMGISRSALVCTAVLMKLHNLPVYKALQLLRSKRSEIDPAPNYHIALYTYEKFLLRMTHV